MLMTWFQQTHFFTRGVLTREDLLLDFSTGAGVVGTSAFTFNQVKLKVSGKISEKNRIIQQDKLR